MLKLERKPSYLSPSSLMQASNMPNTFYLTRLIADRLPREPQSLPAAVGSAFDYYIKTKLVEDCFPHKGHLLPELKKGIETHVSESFEAGKTAFNTYIRSCYNPGIFEDIEIHTTKTIVGVPITIKMDASAYLNGGTIPFEWKVSGYSSATGASPLQGYYRIYTDHRPGPAHAKYTDAITMPEISLAWAKQLCTYGWFLNYDIGKPFQVRLDMLCWRNGKVRIAQYLAWIPERFQIELANEYITLWRDIQTGDFIKRLASTKHEDLVWLASRTERWF